MNITDIGVCAETFLRAIGRHAIHVWTFLAVHPADALGRYNHRYIYVNKTLAQGHHRERSEQRRSEGDDDGDDDAQPERGLPPNGARDKVAYLSAQVNVTPQREQVKRAVIGLVKRKQPQCEGNDAHGCQPDTVVLEQARSEGQHAGEGRQPDRNRNYSQTKVEQDLVLPREVKLG